MKKNTWRYRNHETTKFEFKEKYIYLEGKSDKIHSKDIRANMESEEREQINKNDSVKVSDIAEDLKLVNWVCISM